MVSIISAYTRIALTVNWQPSLALGWELGDTT